MSASERKDTPEQAEFRAQAREWLENNHPGQPSVRLPLGALELSDPAALDYLQKWQASAYEAGLVGADYSTDCGGGGHAGHCFIIVDRLLADKKKLKALRSDLASLGIS